MFKSFLVMSCMFIVVSACKKEKEEITVNKNKEVFKLECKHPRGHILIFKLDKFNWEHANNSRNSIWRFKTITGIKVKMTGTCYTDSSMKIRK